MAEVLLKEKTNTTNANEEVIPFKQLWDLSIREHEELHAKGFLHVTGHPRFPKPQPENQGKYSKLFSHNACFFVISLQGLVFLGYNFRVIQKRNYSLVSIETIEGACVFDKDKRVSLSDIAKRRSDPLCIL